MEVIHYRDSNKGDIYIARKMDDIAEGSVLSNPYKIGEHGTREQVIKKYEAWLDRQIEKKGEVYQELLRLAHLYRANPNLRLVCWCKPKACHGDIVANKIKWLANQV